MLDFLYPSLKTLSIVSSTKAIAVVLCQLKCNYKAKPQALQRGNNRSI